jgi:hypothetical protein
MTIIYLQIEPWSERQTFYTLNVTGVEITHLETGCTIQYNIAWHGLVLQVHLLQYILRGPFKTKRNEYITECGQSPATWTSFNNLKLFQASTVFSQSTIFIVFYQAKKSIYLQDLHVLFQCCHFWNSSNMLQNFKI